MSWKTSPLKRSKILGLFGNSLTADRMYSPHRWEELHQKFQTLLPQKQKTFSLIFIAFLESTQNFAHFEKKDPRHTLNIFEVIDPDKCGSFNAGKLLL